MSNLLLVMLIAIDLILIGLVFIALRRRQAPDILHVIREMDQEQRLLKEMRDSVKEELEQKHADMKQLYERVAAMATDAEIELKNSGSIVSQEVATVLAEAQRHMEEPLKLMTRHRTRLSALIQKSQEERQILQKSMARAEKLARFFDKRIPYQEVLDEIEDKKYSDARFLLSKGLSPEQVARELGLPASEVQMIASMG
jgi:hypothetical protein